MKTETIEFPDETPPVRITVARATNAIGATRAKLYEQADDLIKKLQVSKEPVDTEFIGWQYTTASIFAATIEVTGLPWPMTVEYFVNELPEEISEKWHEVVMRLNPHWNRRITDFIEAQKKVTSDTSVSVPIS